MSQNDDWARASRLAGLRRFAAAITVLNILGHTLFGFEQSLAQPIVAVMTAYATELLIEAIDAWAKGRRAYFIGGFPTLVDFLPSAHITALAIALLLYANDPFAPALFATVVATASKAVPLLPRGDASRQA